MAQVPAVPKLQRAQHLLRASLLGHLTPTDDMVPSEVAALALRAAKVQQQVSEQVTFLIPLVAKHHVTDWSAVTERLVTTLNSMISQDNPNWQAAICCQDLPDVPDDPRITVLPFDDTETGNDKWRKLKVLSQALPQLTNRPGYVMSFDADDVLRQGVVSEMLTRQKPGGYLVKSGLVMDVRTGDIALADNRTLGSPLRKPFWKLCGSCAALYHDPEQPASTAFLAEMTQHEHRMFPYLAKLAGQALTPLSSPSVLYMLNHGENFGVRRGRIGYKTRFVKAYKIDDIAQLNDIARDFHLDEIRGEPALRS